MLTLIFLIDESSVVVVDVLSKMIFVVDFSTSNMKVAGNIGFIL